MPTPKGSGLQVTQPRMVNTASGGSLLSFVMFHSCNAIRLLDPIADIILGLRVVMGGHSGACAFKGGQDCSVHKLLGFIVISAAAVDLQLSLAVAQGVDKRLQKYFGRAIARVCCCKPQDLHLA